MTGGMPDMMGGAMIQDPITDSSNQRVTPAPMAFDEMGRAELFG